MDTPMMELARVMTERKSVILGWLSCMAIDGNFRHPLAATGASLTAVGGVLIASGKRDEEKEIKELIANTYK